MGVLEGRRFGIVDHRLHLGLGFGHALGEGVGEQLGIELVPRRHPLERAGPGCKQRVRARGGGSRLRGGGGFGGGCGAHLAITRHHRGGCKQDRQTAGKRLRWARHR